jgi:SAM-dependent methyltransferase
MSQAVDYDQHAGAYDRRYQLNDYSGIERAVLELLDGKRDLRVLEVGCGTGHWLAHLAQAGAAHAFGLDPSRKMLLRARATAPAAQVVLGSAERLPFRDGSFDRVLAVNALHHFPDKPAFIAEARRVLRSGGRMLTIALDPHTGNDRWSVYDYFEGTLEADLQRYPATERIRNWMRDAGFHASRTVEVQHMPLRLPAREALDAGRLARSATSQLAVIGDAPYQRGLARIEHDLRAAEARGAVLELYSDLRVYGTFGELR